MNKLWVVLCLAVIVSPVAAKPTVRIPAKDSLQVVSRLPLPLRQLLFREFEDAIERAAEDGEKKYPTPDLSSNRNARVSQAEYQRYVDIQMRYVNRLTDRYCAAIRRQYGISSHEEDLIEEEGPAKDWHS